ncbi:hypothetical protein EVAR_42862_1 [Eumeta japonica]|uniref:Uncharacterized protein n=1 Tax=Eumeta variegata TaxID=151549 RepID=A0A4C1ZLI6_EUMVA|nr:hypothetical protein EVAR_42862_1 [Eumeta japonica]
MPTRRRCCQGDALYDRRGAPQYMICVRRRGLCIGKRKAPRPSSVHDPCKYHATIDPISAVLEERGTYGVDPKYMKENTEYQRSLTEKRLILRYAQEQTGKALCDEETLITRVAAPPFRSVDFDD